jgi:hypothetical protein
MPVRRFSVDASGNVSDLGKTSEGPLCIEVFYSPIQLYVSLATTTTTVNGPDLSKVVLGATAQGGVARAAPPAANLPALVQQLIQKEKGLSESLTGIKSNYATTLQQEQTAIARITRLRRTTLLRSPSQVVEAVRNGYKGLQDDLHNAILGIGNFLPTDQPDKQQKIFINQLQSVADQLNRLPLDFVNGTRVDPKSIVCVADAQHPEPRDLVWTDWISQCKDLVFDPLSARITADLQEAKNYTASSDNVKKLTPLIAAVQYWDTIFTGMGLRTDMAPEQIDQAKIDGAFYAYTSVKCGVLFNQGSSTAVNIVAADLGPTLDGNDPVIKAQGAFVTVTCGTPFSVSAGVAFSSIEQKEFAIIKSSGGAGNPSVNKFGTTRDGRFNPVVIGMVHVRLADWERHKYGFHGSFGVAGNLQSQSGGGSTAEFLPGVSFSFWRTMYVSAGPYLGTSAKLAGDFKEGDVVPPDITTISGQVKRTRATGFGFAVTFTKP